MGPMTGEFLKKRTKNSGTNHTSAYPGIVSEYGAVLDVSEWLEHFIKENKTSRDESYLGWPSPRWVRMTPEHFFEKGDKTFRDESYLGWPLHRPLVRSSPRWVRMTGTFAWSPPRSVFSTPFPRTAFALQKKMSFNEKVPIERDSNGTKRFFTGSSSLAQWTNKDKN